MITHLRLRKQLYDFVHGGLEQTLHDKIERHCSSCRECAEEVRYLRTLSTILEGGTTQPSEQRTTEYWNSFALIVEQRVRQTERRQKYSLISVREWLRSLLTFRKKYVLALSGGLTFGIVLALYLFPLLSPRPAANEHFADRSDQQVTQSAMPVNFVVNRAHQYFRKSKVLLVGISNMKEDEDVDLNVERKASRELLHEARYLKTQALDSRSKKLINDLDKILIELADMEEKNDIPNVEILRGGIHQENLLFKIRMAESLYDSSKYISPNNSER
jgi:hypothetical protein